MVTFVTVFLGLVTGLMPVSVAVSDVPDSPAIAAVELRLNGDLVGTMRGEPWTLACDFGPTLEPHLLEAVAYDAQGREVSQTRQWVNLPRNPAELTLIVDGTEEARRARWLWESLDGQPPENLQITLDGQPQTAGLGGWFDLPAAQPGELRFLSAKANHRGQTYSAELALGEGMDDRVTTELTAVPVLLPRKLSIRDELPTVESMRGWFMVDGKPLRVVAVEKGPMDLVMVQDQAEGFQTRFFRLAQEVLSLSEQRGRANVRFTKEGDRLRVLIPTAETPPEATVPAQTFPLSGDLSITRRPFINSLGFSVRSKAVPEGGRQRLADAVALAGLIASANHRPRAVVLMHRGESQDESFYTLDQAREFLERLRVPLAVWTPDRRDPATVDGAWALSTTNKLFQASTDLRIHLDRQAIVWVEGRHLLHTVGLGRAAAGHIELVNGRVPRAADKPDRDLPEADVAAWDDPASSPAMAAETTRVATGDGAEMPMLDADGEPIGSFIDSVDVDVVNVDVVVSDRRGRRITDLTAADFEIFEDGQPVEIVHFTPPVEAHRGVTAEGRDAVEEDTGEDGAEVSMAFTDQPLHVVTIIDTERLRTRYRRDMVDAVRGFIDELPPSSEVLLAVPNRGIRVIQPFTSDRAKLTEALDLIESVLVGRPDEGKNSRQLLTALGEQIRQLEASEDAGLIEGAQRLRETGILEARNEVDNQRRAMRETYGVLRTFVNSLGGIEGRKSLFYLGDGLTLDPAAFLNRAATSSLGLNPAEAFRLGADGRGEMNRIMTDILEMANANGVTIYTATPNRAIGMGDVEDLDTGSLGERIDVERDLAAEVAEATCMMSTTTGGLCQPGGSEPQQMLTKARTDLGTAYSLAYTPRPRAEDGKDDYRKIEVKLARKGLKVRHRQGYRPTDPSEVRRQRLAAALRFAAEDNPLGLSVEAGAAQPVDGDMVVIPFDVSIPASSVALLPMAGSSERMARLELLVQVQAGDNNVTGVQEFPLRFRMSEAQLATDGAKHVHRVNLTLPKRGERIAVGVWDTIGRSGSYLGLNLTQP